MQYSDYTVAKKCRNHQCCFQQFEIKHLAYLHPVPCDESCVPVTGMVFNTSPRLLVKILSHSSYFIIYVSTSEGQACSHIQVLHSHKVDGRLNEACLLSWVEKKTPPQTRHLFPSRQREPLQPTGIGHQRTIARNKQRSLLQKIQELPWAQIALRAVKGPENAPQNMLISKQGSRF